MNNAQRNILVPWDFTPSSNYALEHAINIAKIMKLNISLLHIVSHAKEESVFHDKLSVIAKNSEAKSGIKTSVLIQRGDILTSISDLASIPDTGLVVMKTDGIKGIQKYTGSRAIKIMRGSKAPFIVVQAPPKNDQLKKVIYPIDYRSENKELVSAVLNWAKFYNTTKIYLFKAQTSDKTFKKNIANNLNFAKMMFEGKHMDFEIVAAEGKRDYATEVNEFSHSVNADIIIIQLQRNLTFTKFLFGVKEQQVIANPYKIPVMCVNSKEVRVYAGFR